jgi:hypothetical protein
MAEASFATRLKDASITAIATVVVGALTLAGALATGWFGFASKDEELKVHLVEIAIGILRADPTKEDVAPARGWAIDIIERDSGVKFSAADRAALLHQPIKAAAFVGSWDAESTKAQIEQIMRKDGYIPMPTPTPNK